MHARYPDVVTPADGTVGPTAEQPMMACANAIGTGFGGPPPRMAMFTLDREIPEPLHVGQLVPITVHPLGEDAQPGYHVVYLSDWDAT